MRRWGKTQDQRMGGAPVGRASVLTEPSPLHVPEAFPFLRSQTPSTSLLPGQCVCMTGACAAPAVITERSAPAAEAGGESVSFDRC